MKNAAGQQIEFDVFPKNGKDDYAYLNDIKKDAPLGVASVTVTLPQQSVIILAICVVMSLVASFTLGVERGKLVAKNMAKAPAAPWEKSALPAPAPAAVTAAEKPASGAQGIPVAKTEESSVSAAAAAKKTGPSAGNYVIQVASLNTEKDASRLTEILTKGGWPTFTKTSGKYVVVLAGSFQKKEEALSRIGELKKTYTDCFIKQI